MYTFEADASIHTGAFLLPDVKYTDACWPVVACDQYTSQPDYWEQRNTEVGERPSTLRLILPECWLSQAKERVPAIHETMRKYKNSTVFSREIEGLILIRRTIAAGERWGLLITVDLERYDFAPDSHSLIRPTEGTITDRIPPRLAVRAEAPLELSHILLLADDPQKTLIEPLAAQTEKLPLPTAILIHAGVLYLDYLLIYLLNNWLPRNAEGIGIFTLIFVILYAAIWICIYFFNRTKNNKLNKKLQERPAA